MADTNRKFDSVAFFKALESTALARGVKWKTVSEQTGIGASTLSRMAQGRGPDAASLALLAAWAGLNPADFTGMGNTSVKPEPLARLTAQLRHDPRLSREAADALEEVIKATYQRLADRGESH